MSILYVSVLVVLALVQVLLRWRVGRLERRYVRVATEAHALLNKGVVRPGNSNHGDPFAAARQQYELAQLGLKRDRAEVRYLSSQSFSEKFASFRGKLAGYKGKLLPYTFGVLDVAGLMIAMDRYGVGLEQLKALLGLGA